MLRLAGAEVNSFFVESRTSPRTLLAEFIRLRREVAKFQPHIVHAQYGSMNAFLSAVSGNTPLVITFRGSDLNPVPSIGAARSVFGHLLSNLAAMKAAHVICVSEELRDRLRWARRRAQVIVGGVDLDLFKPSEKSEARSRLGWQQDARVVLFNAGRHPKVKRLDLAEAVVAEARKALSEITMVTLRGDTEPDSMPLYYSAADCLLVTSDWEGSPTVIKEALACNLPVVSVPVGDAVERLKNVTPSAIAGRDPVQLAQAVLQVFRAGIRSNGRQAVQDLSEREEAKRIFSIYASMCHSKD
jgi:teichuronic acid biosynthesis glycosyltransferase TuaC